MVYNNLTGHFLNQKELYFRLRYHIGRANEIDRIDGSNSNWKVEFLILSRIIDTSC